MLKKDHYIFGLLVGIAFPAVIFGLIFIMNLFLLKTGIAEFYLDKETHLLISLGSNLVPIRYYFVNLTFDKTGRGVLLITFALVLFFFAFKDTFNGLL
ncbi:MAG: hypothetical protein H8D45_16080 [Bacteroidetes bacterium]|nr:hypothetical protein [Bacteroidota bacterium]MBL7104641.1 hypothetical protein [Bacteroidales bacterium]